MSAISSLQNNRIKNIHKLSAKARERQAQGIFVIEGARELGLSVSGGYVCEAVFVCPELLTGEAFEVLQAVHSSLLQEISKSVFQKIAYRENSDGLIALARSKPHNLAALSLSENPYVIVLESVEKPGNLGAILRTADAAGADAVIVCDPATDIYNPNTIRSSVGCLFTVPVAVGTNEETLAFLQSRGIRTFAAELTATQRYQDMNFTSPSAIIMGTEAKGLTEFWLKKADERVKIPMRGAIDSLNVSVSAAILTFEAMRQRGL
jgi:TrmH family RNA methyltransferase